MGSNDQSDISSLKILSNQPIRSQQEHENNSNIKKTYWKIVHALRIIRDCFTGVEPVSKAILGLCLSSSILSSNLSKCS